MESNSLLKRLEMYAMINAIENDLVDNLSRKLTLQDIPKAVIEKSQNVKDYSNLLEILRGSDLQGYIEILNANVFKVNMTAEEKNFLNVPFTEIIPVRNRVMHPRLLEFYDYSNLKNCFDNIETELKLIDWKNVRETRKMINENPSALMKFEENLKKKSNRTIENLPTIVDFDDTSFIGRKREIGEIKSKLFKKNVHILSILGDGGVGKTALTIKLLYDLLDDEKCPFELILWVSLKTKELNNYEFCEISNSINNTSAMYEKLASFVGVSAGSDVKQELIELSKNFRTLLVLDNLETINTEEIKEFLDDFSEEGKIIITSRIGLGEMEHRYFLHGLSDEDLEIYTDTLLQLYNKEAYFTKAEKFNYVKNELHSNPLAIKWFIRGLNNGQTPQELLKNKGNLIAFCMSNVYEKLSPTGKEVLFVAKATRTELSFAELSFILESEDILELDLRAAVNDLCKCNFLDSEKFKLYDLLSLTDFAREFIKEYVAENTIKEGKITQRLRELNWFDQSMINKREKAPYSLKTFYYNYGEKSRLVSAYYLMKAVEAYYRQDMDEAFRLLDIAQSLCPQYFECNKIKAYFLRISDKKEALNEYEIAKKNALNDNERRLIFINLKEFCLSNNDYSGALDSIEKAIEIEDETFLQLEKVKILACIGRMQEAEKILDKIKEDCLSSNLENLYLTRKADLCKRQSETMSNYKDRAALLMKAGNILMESVSFESTSLEMLASILKELMYQSFDVEIVKYVYKVLSTANELIFKTSGIKEIRSKMLTVRKYVAEFEHREDLILMLLDYNAISDMLSGKEAVVYSLKDKFGFLKNSENKNGIFFLFQECNFKVKLGDIVSIGEIYETKKGLVAKNITFIKSSIDIEFKDEE